MGKTILQTETIAGASPQEVYDLLMSSKHHGELTSSGANIENREGGEFSVFDGYAKGKNLELEPGKIIKQEWRASDWPEGEKSVVTFEFSESKGGTEIKFTQTGVPDEFEKDIAQGWVDYYWEPMKKYFSKK